MRNIRTWGERERRQEKGQRGQKEAGEGEMEKGGAGRGCRVQQIRIPLGFKQGRWKMPPCHSLHITEALRFRSSGERTRFKVKAGGTDRCEGRSRRMRSRQDPQRGSWGKAGADPACPLGSAKSRSCQGLAAPRCACAALPARAVGLGGAVIGDGGEAQ